MVKTTGMYWETYADQSEADGFTLIGVNDNIEIITNIANQVKEFKRKYGKFCTIKVYKGAV